MAGDFDYDRLGGGYARHRQPDPRIAARIEAALGVARTVVNVGAGAGSYEPASAYVVAVEPSATMRAQRPPHLGPAIAAVAEHLPLADNSVDAAMASITLHQWADPVRGLREMSRVSRGPVVVLTFDRDRFAEFWLSDYAPEIADVDRRRFPSIDAICDALGGEVRVDVVPIPLDCTDGFIEAFYGRPERLLCSGVRAAQSGWSFVEPAAQERAIRRLGDDLASGAWDARFGPLRATPDYDGSLRLIVARDVNQRYTG